MRDPGGELATNRSQEKRWDGDELTNYPITHGTSGMTTEGNKGIRTERISNILGNSTT